MIERILLYLERRRRIAELRSNRSDAATYELAWVTVFEAYYGPNPRPLYRLAPCEPAPYINPHRDKRWFREKYAKPLRRVVAYGEEREWSEAMGHGTSWYTCHLECGHSVGPDLDMDGTARPKHKRCVDCSPLRLRLPVGAAVERVQ
jgi:hypothetical protein